MGQIFGYSKKVWIIILLFLIVLLSGFYLLDSIEKKEVPYEKIIAEVQVIEKEDGLYFKTGWDTKRFADRCSVYELLIIEYYTSCLEEEEKIDPKLKKL